MKKVSMFYKERTRKTFIFLTSTIFILSVYAIFMGAIFYSHVFSLASDIYKVEDQENEPYVNPTDKQNQSIQSYVFTEVEKALGADEAIFAVGFIGMCENPAWDPEDCVAEPNNTVSCGIWMINSIHREPTANHYISTKDMIDYKNATKWAIDHRIQNGNWNAWSCANKLGIK